MSETDGAASKGELPRVLGPFDVVTIVLGSVIGSGIFIVPAAVAAQVKAPALILAVWVVGGVLSFLGALSFAELGAAFPQAGGAYVYLREAYGSLVAFLFGWTLFFVIDSGSIATLAVAFASKYLTQFFPALSPLAIKAVALGLIAVLAAVNILGTRWGARLQGVLTVLKFAAIIVVSTVVLMLAPGDTAHWSSPPVDFSPGWVSAFGAALVASLWAYKGWEVASYGAGEVKRPERNLPLGLFIGTGLAVALYLVANLAYLYAFDAPTLAVSKPLPPPTPWVSPSARGEPPSSPASFSFSIMGAANGNVLTAPRVFFAMARDGLFFKPLARVHPRFQTPHIAILATAAWAGVLSLSGTFEQLAAYVIFGQWIFFGLTVAAVILLRRKQPELARPYRVLGYPVTPILFVAAALFIAVSALINQPVNALLGLGLIVLGVPAYAFFRRRKAV